MKTQRADRFEPKKAKKKATRRSKAQNMNRPNPPSKGSPKSKSKDTLYERFKPFIGIIKDGPPDLAENHKLYASGAKKWK